ncbi:hypothetical protein WUBG_14312, partial [Wuchereria bancrofti]
NFPLADTDINFISWMVFALPLVTACLFMTWLTLVLIFFRKASKGHQTIKDKLKQKYDELPSLSFAEICVSICFLILLTLWITRDPYVVPGFGTLFKTGHICNRYNKCNVDCNHIICRPDSKARFLWKIGECRNITGLENNASKISMECCTATWRWLCNGCRCQGIEPELSCWRNDAITANVPS